ncbi:MAG TPA: hypothetical protein VE710_20310 [Candidatus Bathyarchaeia archaeon]|nr:hypothetical protein [Candidatus Bathyarchaeia archaeon]
MSMINETIQEITKQSHVDISEISELNKLLTLLYQETTRIGLIVTSERMLLMGVHLLAFIRRVNNGEKLPAMDKALFVEIPPDTLALSSRILQAFGQSEPDDTEVFLMAVHLETARKLQEEHKQGGHVHG